MSVKWSEYLIKLPLGSQYEEPEAMEKVNRGLLEATHNQAYFLEHGTGFPRPTARGEFELVVHGEEVQKIVESFFKQYHPDFDVMGPVPHDDNADSVPLATSWDDDLLGEGVM